MKSYKVGIGGGSSHTTCDTLLEAWEVCWEIAEERATEHDIDPCDLDGYTNYGTERVERGVCPAGNDGAYWPHIEEVES